MGTFPWKGNGVQHHLRPAGSSGTSPSGIVAKHGKSHLLRTRGPAKVLRKKGSLDAAALQQRIRAAMDQVVEYDAVTCNCVHFALALLGLGQLTTTMVGATIPGDPNTRSGQAPPQPVFSPRCPQRCSDGGGDAPRGHVGPEHPSQGTGLVPTALLSLLHNSKCLHGEPVPTQCDFFRLSLLLPLSQKLPVSPPLLPPSKAVAPLFSLWPPQTSKSLFRCQHLISSIRIKKSLGCWGENWPNGWTRSGWRPVTTDVPHGSILGPVLVNIFVTGPVDGAERSLSEFAEVPSWEGWLMLQRVVLAARGTWTSWRNGPTGTS